MRSINRKSKFSNPVSLFTQSVSPVIVGRQSELYILGQALREAQQGQGHCLLIAGEAGIGKSRLVAELHSRASAEQFLIWEGHCFEQDLSFPYAPWIDALRSFLAPKSPEETTELLGSLATELLKVLPELSLLIPGLQPSPPLEAGSEKRRLFETVARLGAQFAKSKPLLVVLEDLHWGDGASLELLHFCTRRFVGLPILLVGTYRSDEISPLLSHCLAELNRDRLVLEIRAGPLPGAEIEQITRNILKGEISVPPEWFNSFISLTQGNPFFAEEILKSLIEAGELDKLHVPRSIQDSVQRRVNQLPESTRQVLALASVLGERFDFGLLQEIAAHDEPSLLRVLKELIAAQLIVEQTVDQFAFRHALTRQAVYATLMIRERKALHQKIGDTIERVFGTRTEVSVAQLAYHFYQAGIWSKTLQYCQRAGEQAQALYAVKEASTHFTHALEATQQLGIPKPLSLLRGRAQALEVLGDFEGARTDYEEALELACHATNRLDEWQALIDLGFLWQSRNLERAGEYYQHALELARNLGDSFILAQSLNRVGNWHLNCGRPNEALAFHLEALALFSEINDRASQAHTLDLLGIVNNQLGDLIQGTTYLDQAIPILREIDDRVTLVNTLTNLASQAHFETEVLGVPNYRYLAALSEEARQIAQQFNWFQGEVRALIPLAISLSHSGDFGQALVWTRRANQIIEEIGHRELFARHELTSGQILLEILALKEAKERFESALAVAQELGAGFLTLLAIARLTTAAILQNDLGWARQLLDQWLRGENPQGRLPFFLRRLWSSRAELELAQGNPIRALEIVDKLLASTVNHEQHGPYAIPYLSRLRAQALIGLGQWAEAEAVLRGTLGVASRQEQRSMLWRLHSELGKVYREMEHREDAEQEFFCARTLIQDLANTIPEEALRNNFLKQALSSLPMVPVLTPRQIAKQEFSGLTAREREVAALITKGKLNREIADELIISETTAERHVANILVKLGFNSRTQIAVWAVEKGLGG